MNQLSVKDTSGDFSFLVSGHFYGAPTNNSGFPAATLLAGLDTINAQGGSFFISLGDIFIDVDEAYVRRYERSLFSRLKLPLFNAVGNHDLSNGGIYRKLYGPTYFCFRHGSALFIILDTEEDDGSITGDQLSFFRSCMVDSMQQVHQIFICSHRPVWAENDPALEGLFVGNTSTMIGRNNFNEVIRPLLLQSKGKSIYWLSGSMSDAPVSFFYHKDPGSDITFIQTAIRDTQRDAIMKVNVSSAQVHFSGITLTGQALLPIEEYDIDFWHAHGKRVEPFNYRLLPYLITQMLMHHYFWIGFLSALLLLVICRFFYRRWKRSSGR